MAGSYLPPVVLRVTADIDSLVEKLEAAQAKIDEFEADIAAKGEAARAEMDLTGGGGGTGGLGTLFAGKGGYVSSDLEKATRTFDSDLQRLRQTVTGSLERGLQDLRNNLQQVTGALQGAASGASNLLSDVGGAVTSIPGGWGQITSALGNVVSFAKTWVILLPTVMALPALLGAIGGAAGGAAASFTVLSSAIAIFAAGAMQDLSYVSQVSTMAQFDALSGPLQTLYYALHNFENEWTILSQTIGQTTIVGTLSQMLNTGTSLLERFSPILGQVAAAGSAAFDALNSSLESPQFASFINWIGSNATPVLVTFTQTFTNIAEGWAGLMEALTPAMRLFDDGMVSITSAFANFASTHQKQIQGFISYVQQAWPDVTKFWAGLGHIVYEFFSSASKGAPTMAAALGEVFTTIGNALPTVVPFVEQYLPQLVLDFGSLLTKVTPLIGPLANVAGSLLTVAGAFVSGLFGGPATGESTKKLAKEVNELAKAIRKTDEDANRLGKTFSNVFNSQAMHIAEFLLNIFGQTTPAGTLENVGNMAHTGVQIKNAITGNPNNITIPGGIGAGSPANRYSGNAYVTTPSGGSALANTAPTIHIKVDSHNTLNVAGPLSPDATMQIQRIFAQHDQELVRALNQVRPS